MASFFSKYPKFIVNNKLVTDLIARSVIRDKYSDKLSIFYPYTLQEGDTPEIIASKYYGDPERHWIVMLANNIVNPFYDFALDYQIFNKYIEQKYKNQANSLNIWASSNWRGDWNANEYYYMEGAEYLSSNTTVTYNQNHTIEYIYNKETGITATVVDGGPQDIDITNLYLTANANNNILYSDVVVYSNTAYICRQTHTPTIFTKDLANNYWERIYEGVYWKNLWENDTEYNKDDVVKNQYTIYISLQNHTSNTANGITYSNSDYWKTYNNAIEYASITPYGYRAIITTTDQNSGTSTDQKFYIDDNSYVGRYTNLDTNPLNDIYTEVENSSAFNYANEIKYGQDIVVSTTKERISIFQYEQELNEDKREIKLIRKEYVPQLEQEFKLLMETYYG